VQLRQPRVRRELARSGTAGRLISTLTAFFNSVEAMANTMIADVTAASRSATSTAQPAPASHHDVAGSRARRPAPGPTQVDASPRWPPSAPMLNSPPGTRRPTPALVKKLVV
jgi:hypothetical protein